MTVRQIIICAKSATFLLFFASASPSVAAWEKYGFSLADSKGELVTNERYQNRPLVMVVWATWCAPCIAEFPQLQKLHDEFARSGRLAIISVHYGRNYGRFGSAAGFLKSGGYTVPVLQDSEGKLTRKLNWMPFMVSVPKYVLFDGAGRVTARYDDLDEMAADLRRRFGASARAPGA